MVDGRLAASPQIFSPPNPIPTNQAARPRTTTMIGHCAISVYRACGLLLRAECTELQTMNRSGRNGRNSCVDGEVCANLMISKRKKPRKLLTPPTSLEIAR